MAGMELTVLICGRPAGVLRQDSAGLMSFQYDVAYEGAPLSLSMPVANRTYGQESLRPYLFGLLPDSEQQRRAIARENGVSPNNPVALLSCIGLDCPGGVQFCLPSDVEKVIGRGGGYRKLGSHEISRKLVSIRDDADASWMGREGSWSLGGNQGKFALAWHDGAWCECTGSTPTTHIFKNGVSGFKLEALNEYICMRTAKRVGVPTAEVSYQLFGDEPALVVERFDRLNTHDGTMRLHQEDFCQALGVMPDQKYTSDGGPTARSILELLLTTPAASQNLNLFAQMLFYNCLIGAPDAHAKNYSLLLGPEGNAVMARMYDVASGLPYERTRDFARLAMSIGGENRIGRVGAGAIARFAGESDPSFSAALAREGLTKETCLSEMARLARAIPPAMEEVLTEARQDNIPGAKELADRLLAPVEKNCCKTLGLL